MEEVEKIAVDEARKIAAEVQRGYDIEPVVEELVEVMLDAAKDFIDAHPELTPNDCSMEVQTVWSRVEEYLREKQHAAAGELP